MSSSRYDEKDLRLSLSGKLKNSMDFELENDVYLKALQKKQSKFEEEGIDNYIEKELRKLENDLLNKDHKILKKFNSYNSSSSSPITSPSSSISLTSSNYPSSSILPTTSRSKSPSLSYRNTTTMNTNINNNTFNNTPKPRSNLPIPLSTSYDRSIYSSNIGLPNSGIGSGITSSINSGTTTTATINSSSPFARGTLGSEGYLMKSSLNRIDLKLDGEINSSSSSSSSSSKLSSNSSSSSSSNSSDVNLKQIHNDLETLITNLYHDNQYLINENNNNQTFSSNLPLNINDITSKLEVEFQSIIQNINNKTNSLDSNKIINQKDILKKLKIDENNFNFNNKIDEKLSKPQEKTQKNDEKSTKNDDKSTKTDEKSSKTNENSSKPEEKSSKSDDKTQKNDDKNQKNDDKNQKNDDKNQKNDDKTIKNNKEDDDTIKFYQNLINYGIKKERERQLYELDFPSTNHLFYPRHVKIYENNITNNNNNKENIQFNNNNNNQYDTNIDTNQQTNLLFDEDDPRIQLQNIKKKSINNNNSFSNYTTSSIMTPSSSSTSAAKDFYPSSSTYPYQNNSTSSTSNPSSSSSSLHPDKSISLLQQAVDHELLEGDEIFTKMKNLRNALDAKVKRIESITAPPPSSSSSSSTSSSSIPLPFTSASLPYSSTFPYFSSPPTSTSSAPSTSSTPSVDEYAHPSSESVSNASKTIQMNLNSAIDSLNSRLKPKVVATAPSVASSTTTLKVGSPIKTTTTSTTHPTTSSTSAPHPTTSSAPHPTTSTSTTTLHPTPSASNPTSNTHSNPLASSTTSIHPSSSVGSIPLPSAPKSLPQFEFIDKVLGPDTPGVLVQPRSTFFMSQLSNNLHIRPSSSIPSNDPRVISATSSTPIGTSDVKSSSQKNSVIPSAPLYVPSAPALPGSIPTTITGNVLPTSTSTVPSSTSTAVLPTSTSTVPSSTSAAVLPTSTSTVPSSTSAAVLPLSTSVSHPTVVPQTTIVHHPTPVAPKIPKTPSYNPNYIETNPVNYSNYPPTSYQEVIRPNFPLPAITSDINQAITFANHQYNYPAEGASTDYYKKQIATAYASQTPSTYTSSPPVTYPSTSNAPFTSQVPYSSPHTITSTSSSIPVSYNTYTYSSIELNEKQKYLNNLKDLRMKLSS